VIRILVIESGAWLTCGVSSTKTQTAASGAMMFNLHKALHNVLLVGLPTKFVCNSTVHAVRRILGDVHNFIAQDFGFAGSGNWVDGCDALIDCTVGCVRAGGIAS
jgi:hypothetical protein